jgi:hypothetical protein
MYTDINGIDLRSLRDFIGLESCDESVKQALLSFGYHLATGATRFTISCVS